MNQTKTQAVTELWQTTHNWLSSLGNKPNAKYCREEITTHPDYPAMTAVTDFLESGNMQYQAVQADVSYIHEFNYPLLAHIRQPGQEYMHIIPNAAEWDKQKEITQHWSGIAIFPENNTSWQNEQNSIYQKKAFKNVVFATAIILLGVGLFIASSINQLNISTITFGLLSFLGLIISIVLLGTELGYQSQIIKQVCGAVSSGGCEKVLKSKYAKGMFGITPADASVLYFGTQFIIYLLGSLYPHLLLSIFLLSYYGVAIAAWSIYTQAIKLKQWCVLCLGIIAVLILQTAFVLFIPNTYLIAGGFLSSVPLTPFLAFLLLFTLFAVAMLPIKQLIKTNSSNKQKLAELKKWKTDANLFITQWEQEQLVDSTIWHNDLVIGNPDAPILITVACNPYCGPCAKTHIQLDDLLHRFADKVKIQIRFLCDAENIDDKRAIIVRAILQKVTTLKSNTELQQMLTDWFAWMNFEKWNEKWQAGNDIDIIERLKAHTKWVEQSSVHFTPAFFINGRKLPGRYNLKDVEILLPQLVEVLTNETVK